MTETEQLLRRLLPRYLWLRDEEDGGGALAALVTAVADQYEQLRIDVELLYDQFFIATCDPQYIPLLGQEIGIEGLAPVTGPGISDRALVGRAIELRRRKGTLAAAARGVIAATGWATFVQEGRAVAGATASVRTPHAQPGGFVRFTGRTPGTELAEPWSTVARTVTFAGRPMLAGEPSAGSGDGSAPTPAGVAFHIWRLMSFPVTGRTPARAGDAPSRLAGRAFRFDPLGRDTRLFSVPAPAADRQLVPALSELPLPLTVELLTERLRSESPPPVAVAGCPVLAAGDLSHWQHPHARGADAIVDPLLGRLLLTHRPADTPTVSYAYGFAGELGGGPFGTADDYASLPSDAITVAVAQSGATSPSSIETALESVGGHDASILIQDGATYTAPHGRWTVTVPDGRTVRIASAPDAAPILAGDLEVGVGAGSRLELSGITVDGILRVEGTGELAIEQCTVAPAPEREGVRCATGVAALLSACIVGGLSAGDATIVSTIVDGSVECSRSLDLEQSTVLGSAVAPTLQAGDSIVTGALLAERGLARTSYLGDGSDGLVTIGCAGPQEGLVRFTSLRFGDPAYCQLSLHCPDSISAGAALGGEMGAFNWLGQPARFARVPLMLQELLPAGIAATVHYVN